MAVAFLLAVLFHSNLNRSLIGDFLWAFTQYLETFAIFSQFVLFRNKVSIIIVSKAILRPIRHILWQRRQYLEFFSSYSGYSPLQNWTPIRQVVYYRNMWDIGSCYPKSYISLSWPISCIIGSKLCEVVAGSSNCLSTYDSVVLYTTLNSDYA